MSVLPITVSRFCKDILKQYPFMKQALNQLDQERQDIAESYPGASWPEPQRVKAISDPTASAAFRLLRLEQAWSKTRFYVQAVEDLNHFLEPDERRLVELHYFEGWPDWKTAQALHIEQGTFYRRKRAILILLAQRLGL
ncbi:MAG: transcriptional regulator [Dethiobacter sp.]|nr:transcriptional regulator [Dethiobacter sp.]